MAIAHDFRFFLLRKWSLLPHESLQDVEGHLPVDLVLKAVEGLIEYQAVPGESTTEREQVLTEAPEDACEAFQYLFGVEVIHVQLANSHGAVKRGNLVGMELQIPADLVELGLARHFNSNIQAPEVFLNGSVGVLHPEGLPGRLQLEYSDES